MNFDGTVVTWTCPSCSYTNMSSVTKCAMCLNDTDISLHSKVDKGIPDEEVTENPYNDEVVEKQENNDEKWSCHICTYFNWPKAEKCVMCRCERTRKMHQASDSSPGNIKLEESDISASISDLADQVNDVAALSISQSEDSTSSDDAGDTNVNQWITLNVGGRYFTTTRSTLVTKEPNSMLARMFAENDHGSQMTPGNVDRTGAYMIDRSPKYFEPILNYLRNSQLTLDPGVNPKGVLNEARFYGIDSIIEELEQMVQAYSLNSQIDRDNAPLTRRDVVNALILTPEHAQLRFQGVNLTGADLSKLDLRHINFKYACLRGCKLNGANLSWCSLERADLSNAVLGGAQLLGVKMPCANLESADLKSCNFEDPAGSHANMEGANLKFANLEGSDMAGVNLRVATLKNANLQNCVLRSAILAGADLENCNLSGSDLHDANLRGANLKGAAFELMLNPLHMSQTVRI